MEISDLHVGIGGEGPTSHDFGWLQSLVRRRKERQSREHLSSQLSELLFGVQLGPQEMREYRYSLARILELLDDFEAPAAAPVKHIRPLQSRLFPVGNIAWKGTVSPGEPYAATPTQFFQKRKLVSLHQYWGREEETACHSVAIKLCRGLKTSLGGHDIVLLTPAGVQEINEPTCAPVTVLRLPPRSLKQVDVLKVARRA